MSSMDKKELQRLLQQKFSQASKSQANTEVTKLLENSKEEWLQQIKDAEGDFAQIQQQLIESIQAFCATHLFQVMDKSTFAVKPGKVYETTHAQLQRLISLIQQQSSLNQTLEALENFYKK